MLKKIFYDWFGLNEKLFYIINSYHNPAFDKAVVFITNLGLNQYFYYYFIGLIILALIKKDSPAPWRSTLITLLIAFILNQIVITELKFFFGFPRPFIALPEESLWAMTPDVTFKQFWGAFPSGHSAFAMVMGASLWPVMSKPFKIAAAILVTLIGLSRVNLGMHFPADIIGGFAVAFAIVWAVRFAVTQISLIILKKK